MYVGTVGHSADLTAGILTAKCDNGNQKKEICNIHVSQSDLL